MMQRWQEPARALSKVALAALLLALAPTAWHRVIGANSASLGESYSIYAVTLVYASIGLGLTSVVVAPCLAQRWLRIGLGLVMVAGFGADQILRAVSGDRMTLETMQTLWTERGQLGDAVQAYGQSFGWGLGLAALAAALFFVAPPRRLACRSPIALVPVLAMVSGAALMDRTNGTVDHFPSATGVPAQWVIAALGRSHYRGVRQDLRYDGVLQPKVRKIVFIIDESVRSDFLQINNPAFDNTPFLSSLGGKLINFGTATSIANCSAAARLFVRTGIREHELPDSAHRTLKKPTMWHYAKRAGYRTIHLDAWNSGMVLHSYMNKFETKWIDEKPEFRIADYLYADDVLADRVLETLARDEPMLIYVEKIGVHFPYHVNVPRDFTQGAAGLDRLPSSIPAERHAVVAEYLRSIRWRLDRFFERLAPALARDDVLVIYTSDHGQSMFEGGYELSHCMRKGAVRGEGMVPLFSFANGNALSGALAGEALGARDRASHFEIFPTLLAAMGYPQSWVARAYGPSLLDVPRERKRRFLTSNLFNAGRATWVKVDD